MARIIDLPPKCETVEDIRRYLLALAQDLTDALNELDKKIEEEKGHGE